MDFRRSLIFSAVFHACLFLAALIGLPQMTPMVTEPIASIPVDLISEEPAAKGDDKAEQKDTPQAKAEPVPVVTPAEKDIVNDKPNVPPKTAEAPPPPTEAPPPPEEQQPEKQAEKPPEKTEAKPEEIDPEGLLKKIEEEKKIEEQKKQDEAKREEEKKKAAEEKKIADQKKRDEEKKKLEEKKRLADEKKKAEDKRLAAQAEKFDADKISNLINNQDGAQKAQAEQGEQRQATLGAKQGTGQKLTQSQRGLLVGMIQDQMRPCYSIPPGAEGKTFKVQIQIFFNPDGSLQGSPDVKNNDSDPSFRSVASAGSRAIQRCAPFKLPADMYDTGWKDVMFQFSPESMQ